MNIRNKGKQLFAVLLSVAMIITTMPFGVVVANAVTAEFAGGSGTETAPYLIETKEHLNNVRNDLNAHYELIADIVFTDDDFSEGGDFYNNQKGWIPIGQLYSTPFNGTFDGNGFAIVGLFAKVSNYNGSYSGLFGINNGTIMNLAVVNGSITDTSSGYTYVGGIAGRNTGTISNCYNSMTVSTMTYGGGIAGQNAGLITDCYNIGNVIKAQNYGTISGGIVGYNLTDATISSCYNAGNVTANQQGGVAGENRGTILHCYFLESEEKGCAQGTNAGYRCSIEELQTKATFEGFRFDTTWEFINLSDYPFPVLKGVKHIPIDNGANQEGFAGGIGSLICPYLISDASQLANVQKFPDSCFKLTNDIVFATDDISNWISIGTASQPFTGYFDGDGYAIKGLTKSLFNYNNGTVKNIALKNAVVTDSATIILNNRGILSNCYSSSEISFSSKEKMSVGGLVSKNYGTISNCFYNGKINSTTTYAYESYTGGIAGSNDGGTISSCYNLAIITTNKSMDGIAGEINNATMKNNYYYEFFALGYQFTQNGGVKATVDQLKKKDFFVGFDFDSEWQIDETLEYPAPTLKVMKSAIEVIPENTTDFAGGNGSLFSPYLISNIQQLYKFSSYANLRCHFKLIDDIVLDEIFEKRMISSFNGMLDGEMHTISGFTVKSNTVDGDYVGFIGTNKGIIKNLKFKDSNIEFSELNESYVGTVVGHNDGTILDLEVETKLICNNITAEKSYIGGVAGGTGVGSVIENLQTTGIIDISSDTSIMRTEIGGIIGKGSGKIVNITNDIDITLNSCVGPVQISNSNFGGIIGYSSSSTKQNVRNSGNISIYANNVSASLRVNVGGIAGTENAGSTTFASNSGDIFVKSVTCQYDPLVNIGGIVGRNYRGSATIKKSYNTGNIGASMDRQSVCMGGIIGYYPYLVEDCYNTGKIGGTTLDGEMGQFIAGGIAGHGEPTTDSAIKRCYNIGEISAQTAGGIIGYRYGMNIYNCYYTTANKGVGDGSQSNTYYLTTQQLRNASGLSTFDFNSVWTIDADSDYCFPTLRNFSHVYVEHTCTIEADDIKFNELQHWEYCVFCGKEINKQEHSFDCACDETCNGCDYIRDLTGAINTEWCYDDNNHWQICLSCNEKINNEAHKYVTGESLACSVCSKSRALSFITITQYPQKLQYIEGQNLNLSGLLVTAYYDNNTSAIISNYVVSGYDSTPGTKTITVAYNGKTDTFTVTVLAKSLSSIAVTTKPSKLTYTEGDAFDKSGMVVTAYYNNNTSSVVTDYTLSGYKSTSGTKTITVTYGGKTATFTVTVNSRVPATVTSSKHTINGNNISKITAGTTVSSLLSGLNEGSYCKVYKGNSEVSGNTAVGTGMVVKIMDGNTVKASYTVIVTGDTNGDGTISVTDMIAIKAHILNKSTLTGVYAIAANTNGDSRISITDFIQVKAKILGKGSITAR